MKRKVIIEIISLLFILLFTYAAVSKLIDYEKFKVQIGQSPLLTAYEAWIVWAVPGIEIVISFMLAIPRTRHLALYGAFSMMVMFSAYIVVILNFSDYVPCSCGGILEKLGWTEHLFFNIGFVLLALWGIILISKDEENNTLSISQPL